MRIQKTGKYAYWNGDSKKAPALSLASRCVHLALAMILLLPALNAYGQFESASVLGYARDASGAAVPNVIVTLTNTATGIATKAKTDSEGRYEFPSVPIGNYQVQAEAGGFERTQTQDFTVTTNARQRVDVALKAGSVNETVTVTSEPTVLETETSSRGHLIEVVAGTAVLAMGHATFAQNSQAAQDKIVHLNQIQVIGSHNSYHAGFAPSERKYMEMKNPKALRGLDYHHATLGDQLSGGVRQVEIDVFADPDGGRFAHPSIVRTVAAAGLPADPDFDPQHEMDRPGFKVMHVQDLDERSTCHTFVACLNDVRTWSKQHPHHLPIFILVETKEDTPRGIPNAVKAETFTPALFDALDTEIRSVFKPGEIITPDEVRGNASTLVEAVHAGKWPTLAQSRGRVIFLMDQQHVGPIYTQGHPSLRGRILFTNALAGAPDAAFIEQNGGSLEEINALVKQGYLVRTRTDEGTEQARTNDTTRRDLALSSGAQMLSTDYPLSEPSPWTTYSVGLPHGLVARCNPVNKPAGCVDALLEPTSGSQ